MKLTVVGATGSMSGPDGAASCYLVQADGYDPALGRNRTWSMVMDMGPGAFGQLWRYLEPRDLDAVLITHGHADHLADIISMQVYLRWNPAGAIERMPLFGPAEIPIRVSQIDGYCDDIETYGSFDFHPVSDGTSFDVGPMRVTSFPGRHLVESYGFRVEGPSDEDPSEAKTLAYTGDTDSCPSMVDMARDADLLVSECGFTDDVPVTGVHLSGTRAGELARDAAAKRLVLTHIQPWTDPEVLTAEAANVVGYRPEVAAAGKSWTL